MAVRALANVWVRIVHAAWLKQARYDPEIYVTAQQVHGSTAA
jgi:hypothetical protein